MGLYDLKILIKLPIIHGGEKMYVTNKITTLAEDFQALGLIRTEAKVEQKEVKKPTFTAKQIAERRALIEKKKRLVENKKKAPVVAQKKKVVEQKKIVKKAANSTQESLNNLQSLEQKLRTNTSMEQLIKAYENVSKVSSLAMRKFKKLSEEEAADYNKSDSTDKPQAGKGLPAEYNDMIDGQDHEGNVGHSDADKQEGNVDSTGEVDTVSGKYAGQDKMIEPEKVDIVENDEDLMSDEEMMADVDMGDEELDAELTDDEIMADDDMELGDEFEDEFADEELPVDGDEEVMPEEDEIMPEEDELDTDLDDDDDVMPEEDELMPDEDDALPAEDEILPEEDEKENEEEEEGEEKVTTESKKVYISELADIKKEAEDIMARIRKSAITPQDAEALLGDIVMRLGGAVGELGDMTKYNGGSEQSAVAEGKKKKKK
jgi:predicted house-cleaning NTP pyrophosphatase (Maf/HAM1 superfamily)